ncbi:MAG: HD domain-containing protein [Candidatus Dormibacterales bacterium]
MADPVAEYSRVNLSSDPLYGYVTITKAAAPGRSSEQDLLDSPWLQRLRRIHQLQSAWWVFATAEHSRFQHSLGAMHLAGEWARHLEPTLRQVHPEAPSAPLIEETLRLAGLLHDVGHGPFGHFFDENYLTAFGIDHESIGRALITGPLAELIGGVGASPSGAFAAGEHVDPRWVAHLISERPPPEYSPPPWLGAMRPLLTGPFSADNMDYVPRDAYVCGIATGPVDVRRIIHYSFLSERGLALHAHGAEALHMFLVARLYLYHQVYFHRTVRRIDLQLREVFAPTLDIVLGGDPLQRLDAFRGLTEWYLLSEVDRWAQGDDPERRALGRAWADVVGRRLRWTLVYSSYVESRELEGEVLFMTRPRFEARIREGLPPSIRDLEFEVDVASQQSGALNPIVEKAGILFYDPLQDAYLESGVADIFARLPVTVALFRVFARDGSHRQELSRAAERALGRSPG